MSARRARDFSRSFENEGAGDQGSEVTSQGAQSWLERGHPGRWVSAGGGSADLDPESDWPTSAETPAPVSPGRAP